MGGPELMRSRRLIVAGFVLAVACTVVVLLRSPSSPEALLGVAPMCALAGASLRRGRLRVKPLQVATELTPAGVRTIGPLFDRLIPWQALAPGGPARPALNADRLSLDIARPDLVDQRGWEPGSGPRHDPKVSLRENIHPWILADTIRWYVEHPADRDALGTPGAQDRLIAALAGTRRAA